MEHSSAVMYPPPLPSRVPSPAIISKWAVIEHVGSPSEVQKILAYLNEDYVASQPRLLKAKALPAQSRSRNWRSLFYRNVSSILK